MRFKAWLKREFGKKEKKQTPGRQYFVAESGKGGVYRFHHPNAHLKGGWVYVQS
ncbi:hypothetical protein GQ600_7806 [Phytophthora cactorum]|nr:hypothetical protein GQ600_7806 [Phytophthora cactorum]